MSYGGDPSLNEIDAIRFMVGDTEEADEFLRDEEIQWLIDNWYEKYGSYTYVAAVAAEMIAAKFAREVSLSADGVSVGIQDLQNKYETLAVSLREQYKAEAVAGVPDAGGLLWGEEFDDSIKPLTFGKGMHDNVEAGRQDYGGKSPTQLPPEYGQYY